MKHKTICVNKQSGYIIITLLVAVLIVIANNLFLQKKTTYKSKAQEVPTTSPSVKQSLTSAPLKILEYWLAYKKPTLRAENDQKIKAFATTVPELNSLTYIGDLKSPEDFPALSTWGCSTTGSTINEPFGITLRELYKSSDDYNDGFNMTPTQSLSFYKNANNELSIVATSWNNNGGTIKAMRYFPYRTLVNAFSAVLYEQKGTPMVSESMDVGSCFSANYKRWVSWAHYVINDNGVVNVPANNMPLPTPNPLQEKSAYQYQLDSKITAFMERFISVYKTSYPEVALYPYIVPVKDKVTMVNGKKVQTYVPETMSTNNIPGNFPAPGMAFTKTHPGDITKGFDLAHITYYFDKCKAGATGNYYTVKTILEPKWEEYIEQDGTNQKEKFDTVTGLNMPLGVIQVMHRKTFINYPLAGVKPAGVTVPTCTSNYYDTDSNPCPLLSKDIEFKVGNTIYGADNAFFLTLKPIADSSCDYPKRVGSSGRNDMMDEITLVIYLGNP